MGIVFPGQKLITAITEAYSQLCQRYSIDFSYCDRFEGEEKEVCKQYTYNVDVAVRSSATAEDLPDAGFAGQQETSLNVHDIQCVLGKSNEYANLIEWKSSKNAFDDFKANPNFPCLKYPLNNSSTKQKFHNKYSKYAV